jgi:glycosyltransferase involved in cell wall biosynthesis
MKILLINTLAEGGAANACIRLHLGLRTIDVESKLLVFDKNPQTPYTESFMDFYEDVYIPKLDQRPVFQKVLDKINTTLGFNEFARVGRQLAIRKKIESTKSTGIEVFTFPHSPYRLDTHPLVQEADIIHLHWVNNFLDYETFFANVQKPTVWTLHEMNPFTGGCSYSDDCFQYETKCITCPQLKESSHPLYAQTIFDIKAKALKQSLNLHIVSPSQWLKNLSRNSTLLKPFSHYHIPYGINENIFNYQDKNKAKQALNLPLDKKMILFVSASVGNKRKGLHYLIESIGQLNELINDITVCAVGNVDHSGFNSNVLKLGSISDESKLALIYAAADVFVIPSIADNLPNTVLESLMCGTPVIGFPAGGIPEMIEPKVNGIVCEDISSKSLFLALKAFLSNTYKFDSTLIAEKAREKYSLVVQAKSYQKLYKKLLSS